MVYSVSSLANEQWHRTLQMFADASIYQTKPYAAARWPRAKLEHLVIEHDGKPAAAAQVMVFNVPLLGGGLAYIHFGPVWRANSAESNAEILEHTVSCLIREYVDKRGMLLRIRPAPVATDGDPFPAALQSQGFSRICDASPDRFFVDLSYSLEDLHRGLSGKWRYNLKRSEKSQLEVRYLQGSQALSRFSQIYTEMTSRKGFVDDSAINEFPEICANLPQNLQPQILLCFDDGKPVAGLIVSLMGDTAAYLFGASDSHALKKCAGYLLQWSAIAWLRERGCRWYDLGGDSGSAGLRQFKSGLVGRYGTIAPRAGDFEQCNRLASRAAVNIAFGYRNLLRGSKSVLHRILSA